MNKLRLLLLSSTLLFAATPVPGQVHWLTFDGPVGEEWSRMGTDGSALYFTTGGNQLWSYAFPTGLPNLGTWTRLTDSPRTIDAWDSYRGLAFQSGYLYTSALPSSGGGRTIVRYDISNDSWEVWGNPTGAGTDLTISNTSGNGMFMDPALPGVGYSAWHAGGNWVSFDWNAQTANNTWLSPASLAVPDSGWVSRNEMVTGDGAGTYYATKNDWLPGASAGDVIYSFGLVTPAASLVATKPFQAGAGQSLQFIPATHALNQTGNPELWLFRGGDGLSSAHEGWSNAGTHDMSLYDLTAQSWFPANTPLYQGQGSDSVVIGDCLFVKASGDATTATSYNDDFMVMVSGASFQLYGDGCPGDGGVVPAIGAVGGPPTLGNASHGVQVTGGAGGALGFLLIGFSETVWNGQPLPFDLGSVGATGCFLLNSADVHAAAQLTGSGAGNGSATVPLAIPNNPALHGGFLSFQWLLADSNAPNPLGIAATGGGRSRLAR